MVDVEEVLNKYEEDFRNTLILIESDYAGEDNEYLYKIWKYKLQVILDLKKELLE